MTLFSSKTLRMCPEVGCTAGTSEKEAQCRPEHECENQIWPFADQFKGSAVGFRLAESRVRR